MARLLTNTNKKQKKNRGIKSNKGREMKEKRGTKEYMMQNKDVRQRETE